ncbi:BirA family transcriptional regulator [endosymbiont of Ridgeia piscesae]|uniref:Bifunctional ligase/repressor BirA n=2 Tax=endosymbiont of Ridgeia piscesae TaxID=54398 RepID=A0A0T5ZBH3_9GAMM|nr:BirA family transcriptional regulator [endosymbiont of Ridgeia piscesae]
MAMPTRIRLLQLLADGRFHSGESLAVALGVSRAAIWKQVRQLRDAFGQDVHAVRGRGYRLARPLDLLDSERISAQFSDEIGVQISVIHLHQSLDSTNSWLMEQARKGAANGTVCLAEQQSAGRGRHGRRWISPYGSNVYLSLLWRFELAPMRLSGLSLAAGIAVLRTLRELGAVEAGLKWPNDILWQQKKLAGLLLEVSGESEGPAQVVLGVGLNTHMDEQGAVIDQPWTDLRSIAGVRPHTRNELVASLIENLVRVANLYASEGLQPFMQEWHDADLMLGRQVVVRNARGAIQGQHRGIDENGALLLAVEGDIRSFHAGEVSLRSEGS